MPPCSSRSSPRHRSLAAAAITLLAAAVWLGGSVPATTAAGFRPCGTIKGAGNSTIKVFARPASMSCEYARVVARHANPYGGKPDFQGWRCYHFTAALQAQGKLFECTKGKRYVQGRTR